MRVLICPDKFAGTLSAFEVADALANGWTDIATADVVCKPLSDGGPGFVTVLSQLPGTCAQTVATVDPLGRPVTGTVLFADGTAYVESAHSCGLRLLAPDERNPLLTSSYGLGVLVQAALKAGTQKIVLGLGGSATNDAGAGMLAALGAPAVDAAEKPLPPGGAALAECVSLGGAPQLHDAHVVAAVDVDNPLTGVWGASYVFGPQKGASRQDVVVLDAAVAHFAGVLEKELKNCPPGLAALPGGGAAGGIGAAVLALGGHTTPGVELVAAAIGLDKAMARADVVITGEGSFDAQSLRGKVVSGVARLAAEHGVPCLVVAGRVTVGRREAAAAGVTEVYSLVEHVGSEQQALSHPEAGLFSLGRRIAQQWRRLTG